MVQMHFFDIMIEKKLLLIPTFQTQVIWRWAEERGHIVIPLLYQKDTGDIGL